MPKKNKIFQKNVTRKQSIAYTMKHGYKLTCLSKMDRAIRSATNNVDYVIAHIFCTIGKSISVTKNWSCQLQYLNIASNKEKILFSINEILIVQNKTSILFHVNHFPQSQVTAVVLLWFIQLGVSPVNHPAQVQLFCININYFRNNMPQYSIKTVMLFD